MRRSGFTLIELIFVIVIIGILAAVAVPRFLETKKSAEVANIKEVANQLENKLVEHSAARTTNEDNITKVIEGDDQLTKYVEDMNQTFLDNRYHGLYTRYNDTNFTIWYKPDGNNTEEVNNANTATGSNDNALCVRIEKLKVQKEDMYGHPFTTYNWTMTEYNSSCNQEK